ncbi:hypothetical protein FA95DRAFT_1507003, partial [Auriscalpium vulgare]
NPQASELCSHIGMHGNKYCRRCDIGGTREHKESNEGYTSLFEVCIFIMLMHALTTAALGVQEAVDKLQTATGVKDKIAQHWINKLIVRAREQQSIRLSNPLTQDPRLRQRGLKGDARVEVKRQIVREIQDELLRWLPTQPSHRYEALDADSHLDIHRDTPCEILHTYLLGQDKYVWYLSHKPWEKKQEEQFVSRLQSASIDGLSVAPVRASYVMQYKNALIGKHFKMLQQLAVFQVHDICPPHVFSLWKATGQLGALLWYHTITDMATYLSDLQILIDNVLDLWALIDSSRIIDKPKLHILTYLVPDIRRFGPAILYSTEGFECWNAIFRMCSVLSNHAAPSRDIAMTLADMERFKHQVSGGWWRDQKPESTSFVRAGEEVRKFLARNSGLQRRLGWVNLSHITAGTMVLLCAHRIIKC